MRIPTLLVSLLPFVAMYQATSLWETFISTNPNFSISSEDNDAFKSMKEICNENGFALEEYSVTTSDGYILTLYRIPGNLSETLPTKKPVVLL